MNAARLDYAAAYETARLDERAARLAALNAAGYSAMHIDNVIARYDATHPAFNAPATPVVAPVSTRSMVCAALLATIPVSAVAMATAAMTL